MNEPRLRALLIEDDSQIRRFVRTALEAQEFEVFEAERGEQGLIEAGTRKPDLLILDLGLPDMDGVTVVQRLREWSTVPIVVLSARSQENTKIACLDAGADDYLTKPFGVGELLARIRVALRHRNQNATADNKEFVLDRLRVDFELRRVSLNGEDIHLTPIEYRLLVTLIRNAGKVMTHRQLLRDVWGPSHTEDSHYVRIYMAQLRHKLEQDPAQPRYLLTETGVGYRFADT
jgi:two-component system, OmpR family, KDP operon response regulator KdpE